MTQSHEAGVVAVVVTYQPVLVDLEKLLDALIPQVESVVVVDNGSHADLEAWNNKYQTHAVKFVLLGENRGIAAAQNAGIQWARNRGARFVLLMDQDSIPAPDMVEKLVSAISEQASPATAGPRYLDERQDNPPPFIRIRGLRLERCACSTGKSVVPVDYLISSGCLIPMPVLDKVGGMRDDLFIDYVDIEWGLRARHHGFQSYGVCSAHMQHSLGDHPIEFFGKNIPLHSPLRHYYHFRNAVLLYKKPWVPLNWKLVDGWRLCLKYVFYSLFAKPRMAHWRMMTSGVWHGWLGKTGKFERS
ncbi:dTDP-rhamnosyl transferase RfbF [Sulfuriferula plumbiphila]|uniref:dTDP-rhamnosyl transferase RfbF n=1 Tax=Sulfuriferula plumbiphila TaxID=171865 RepID=A0A512LCG1_9PROT|nr:glycosyltransferase family 2 protein [Sulfuriferula plumbiphila]BBP05742.1 dTDP-rhamnosyl transferase RfbF [Sulfuriferula plumbiphila]GEP32176.1 dTDP-rhamnosyl transferase RfbF [Sulfuriferula plumbiphila]